MSTWPIVIVFALLFATVFSSLWIGVWVGTRRRVHVPDREHLGTIQGALLGLLGLVLGFSFSGAMGRFIDRQDALWTEASAIENAYERAELLSTADQVRQSLREYASLRLELFQLERVQPTDELRRRLIDRLEVARIATYDGVRLAPQFANLAVSGLEAVSDEFARRNAFDRRHLPTEMVAVLILSSCLSMGTIGYALGLAERRTFGAAISLAALISVTLFVTFDFDRPRGGFITLDASPLENTARRLNRPTTAPSP